jgi:hypothetical protein
LIEKIVVHALPYTQTPSASNLISLLNISRHFDKHFYAEESLDVQFLAGLSLVQGRKFVQAVEIFKKIQERLLSTIGEDQSSLT